MSRLTRVVAVSALCIAALFAVAATAGAATLEHLSLDSYFAWHKKWTPPSTSTTKLKSGKLYVAAVQGTFSYYGAINYAVPQPPWTIVCGTPASAPQFSSAGGSGKVGFDAEFIFSRPWLPAPCEHAKLPVRWTNFQVNPGTGVWAHPTVLANPAPTVPSPSHVYEYALVGHKHHVSFRLYDIDTRDNYGSLHISLRTATEADCQGGKYAAFGLGSEAQCIASLP